MIALSFPGLIILIALFWWAIDREKRVKERIAAGGQRVSKGEWQVMGFLACVAILAVIVGFAWHSHSIEAEGAELERNARINSYCANDPNPGACMDRLYDDPNFK